MKKYYINHVDEIGNVIFSSQSNSAAALLKRYNKAAYSSDGSMYSNFYLGSKKTNITEEIMERVACGEKL